MQKTKNGTKKTFDFVLVVFSSKVHTCNDPVVGCHWDTGEFQGRPSHFDSDRMTENADSQVNQPESDLTAAGRCTTKRKKCAQVRHIAL